MPVLIETSPGIVACGDDVGVESFLGVLEEQIEFDVRIAQNVWIGRQAGSVVFHEVSRIVNDVL